MKTRRIKIWFTKIIGILTSGRTAEVRLCLKTKKRFSVVVTNLCMYALTIAFGSAEGNM